MLWRSFRHHLLIALSALDTKGLCPSNQLLVRVLLALPIGNGVKFLQPRGACSWACCCDYALHLGLTEAGMGMKAIVASAAGHATPLRSGIGDTIRVSLTPTPGGDRSEEVRCGQQILQSLGIRSFMPKVTSCPGCRHTTSTYFQELAERIQGYLVEQVPEWKKQYAVVEEPKAPVYVDGKLYTTLKATASSRSSRRS